MWKNRGPKQKNVLLPSIVALQIRNDTAQIKGIQTTENE
jgi:hypothetical protein